MTEPKPRVSVRAATQDSFQNVTARMGQGTSNLAALGTYGYNIITRNRELLDRMYRGSWIVGAAVDAPADDMVKAGITIKSDLDPEDIKRIGLCLTRTGTWDSLSDVARWARLYGGCIGVILIEGQQLSEPLRVKTVGRGQFRGIAALDRWMLTPSLEDVVTDIGPSLGKPKFYLVSAGTVLANERIHHSRIIRLDGLRLPYWQRQAEMGWGMSVMERIYDRLLGFDSTTTGVAQLVYRAHLRVMKVDSLRTAIAAGGKSLEGIMRNLEMIRALQSTEGMTVIDAKDDFQSQTYTFAGLSDVMLQFAQQLSGALKVPMVRLFGQTPTGLNTSGEADLRNYYDGIAQEQERELREPVQVLLQIAHRSALGRPPEADLDFEFDPLWQTSDGENADIAGKIVSAVQTALDAGIIDRPTAMKELKASSEYTSVFSNITDEAIQEAELEPPMPGEMPLPGDPEDPLASPVPQAPPVPPQLSVVPRKDAV